MTLGPILAVLITFATLAVSLVNWRYGFLCVVVIGVLQDVLRKITPQAPPYFIVWSFTVFALVVGISVFQAGLPRVRLIWMRDNGLKQAFMLFFALIAIYSLYSLVLWQTLVYPVFGLIFYIGPIVALLVVITFASQPGWVKRFINVYLWIMVPAALSVYLSLWFKDVAPVLRDVGSFTGQELIIYDVGTILYSYPGLFRVGEIAAFHAATSAAFLSILMQEKNRVLYQRVFHGVLILLLVGAIVLTGRRKMLMAISLFFCLQIFLLSIARRGFSRQTLALLILGVLFSVGVGYFGKGEKSGLYLQRGTTVFQSVGDRSDFAVQMLQSALGRANYIGLGAGVASQGARFTSAGDNTTLYVGGSSESGIGYIAVELGVPGLLVLGWLGFNLLRVLKARMRVLADVDQQALLYAVSFIALLIANMATFMVATQLYGDYFVLITLGVIAGLLYATINQTIFNLELLVIAAHRRRLGVSQNVALEP